MQSTISRIIAYFKAHRKAKIFLGTAAIFLLLILLLHPQGTKTFLILGMDNYDSLDANSGRSDVTMLVQIDFTRGQIKTVSFARDMFLKNEKDRDAKLNMLIRSGTEETLVETIERNFGVKIDGWFRVNFASVILLVDALGGVDLELTSQEANYIDKQIGKYEDHPLSEGLCHLNGEQALTYARCRKLDNDIGRGARQGKLITAMVATTRHMTISKIVGVFHSLKDMWRSSLSAGAQVRLLSQAVWLRGARTEAYGVPFDGLWWYGDSDSGVSGVMANLPENRRLLLDALGYPPEKETAE
ncbi:MAG: LCP family protein [Clostridia bacterium]|nr:LCP family protein [Clostridia bacterium]